MSCERYENLLKFVVVGRRAARAVTPQLPYPYVMLVVDNWDDYGYKTMFDVGLRTGRSNEFWLGRVKILQCGQQSGRPAFPSSSFDGLDANFCSLGQDIEYYENLMGQPEDLRRRALST